MQGSKIALVRSYLRVPQAAGQVKILIFLVKIKKNPMYANIFCDAGQVPILRYFGVWNGITVFSDTMIRFSTLKHFWKHFLNGQVKNVVSVTRDDAD